LGKSGIGDGVRARDGGPSVGEGVEGVSGVVNISMQVLSVVGDKLVKESKLTDASVLDFDVSETAEFFRSNDTRF